MKEPKAGTHDYIESGICGPNSPWETFSVGVFEWVPRGSGNGTKPSKAKVRVKGSTRAPDLVYAKAREIADSLDAGTYAGPKTVTL